MYALDATGRQLLCYEALELHVPPLLYDYWSSSLGTFKRSSCPLLIFSVFVKLDVKPLSISCITTRSMTIRKKNFQIQARLWATE